MTSVWETPRGVKRETRRDKGADETRKLTTTDPERHKRQVRKLSASSRETDPKRKNVVTDL